MESPDARILNFLRSNQGRAYTEDMITEAINLKPKVPFAERHRDRESYFSAFADLFRFHNAIEKLIAKGEVERRSIRTKSGQETHYRAK